MANYEKEKWNDAFPDRAGQEVRPDEAIDNSLDYDTHFPQYLSDDPVVYNLQNKTIGQLVSNDERLYERISATAADFNAHLTDAKAHANGIAGNAATATKMQTGRKIHRVLFDGTEDITLPDFTGCSDTVAGQSGVVPAPAVGKTNTVLHSNGAWGKVTYADMADEAVKEIQACPFPVSSVYISVDGKNPATYWPGTTWVAFAMGRCLIGAGTADSGTIYTGGQKLGEEKHILVVKEIPAHLHSGKTGNAGGHNHTRGNMNITGYFPTVDMGGREDANGAFWISGMPGANARSGSNGYDEHINFSADRTWTGVTSWNGDHWHSFSTGNTGGNQAHNNMQPSIAVYIFKRTA